MRIFLSLYFFLLLTYIVSGQSNNAAKNIAVSNYDFYDNKNGMSQGTVNSILQDKYGYIWFGTQDGLNKFDGKKFIVFKNIPNDSTSISDNFITSLIKDKNGDIWIGTKSGGLNKYDISKGKFIYYRNDLDDNTSISNNSINALAIDKNGTIWVATQKGINYFHSETEKFERFIHNPEDNSTISSNTVYDLFFDSNNVLWVGTSKGLNRFIQSKETFQRFIHNEKKGALSNNIIYSIWEDSNHKLWLGTENGLNIFDRKQMTFSLFNGINNKKEKFNNEIILDLTGDQNGNLWVATDGDYISQINIQSQTYKKHQVSFPRVQTVFEDNVGDIWVGLRGGVNKISKLNAKFTQYANDSKGVPLSPNADIHALFEDKKGNIWIGSSVDGLIKFNRKTLVMKKYIHDPSNQKSISNNNIRYLTEDKKGNIWVATYNGLNKFNPKNETFYAYKPNNSENSLSDKYINAVFEGRNNMIWACTFNGLNRLNPQTGEIKVFKNIPGEENSLGANDVRTFYEDSKGNYWIGFSSHGLDHYDPKNDKFTHFTHSKTNPNSLSNDRVFNIYEDNEGLIWIATYGGGLNRYNNRSKNFTQFGLKEGLANEALYCVIPDKNNHLWMSHNEGFSRFDMKAKVFKNYFQGKEFNSGAFFQNNEGEIFFGSDIVVAFQPATILDNDKIPPVHITSFKIFSEEITPDNSQNITNLVWEATEEINLKYDQNFFSLNFITLNYTHPENNLYQYKLENFDPEWINADDFQQAVYTNVPPGEYIFKVKGSNNDHVWNEKGDSLKIFISPPWWETIWFKISAALFIIALLITVYKLRLRNIKRQKAALEQLVEYRTQEVISQKEEILAQKENITSQNTELIALNEEKNELIQIVAHDLRSPLNQIKGMTMIIKLSNPDLDEETASSIASISELVEQQLSMISKVLDVNAIEAHKINLQLTETSVNDVLQYLINNFKIIADNKEISLIKDFYNESLYVEVDKNYLIQILENILANAIKFSPKATEVTVSSALINKKVRIIVSDQGPGINKKDKLLLFHSFTKLSAKPTAGEASTGLGLSIAKKYVEAMNGKIWCESEINEGAKFIIEFEQYQKDLSYSS